MAGSGNSGETGSLYKEMLFDEATVDARIMEMAIEVVERYDPATTVFVDLLNGARPFASKLMFAIQKHNPHYHPNLQSMIVSRYGPNREPGPLRLITDLPPEYRNLTGYKVVLLDDMIDGGDTLEFSKQHVLGYGATEVDIITLVRKLKDPPATPEPTMYGFDAPNKWLTGMGMDDSRLGHEANRWAGWIAIAND